MADNLLDTIKDGSVDATALSSFMIDAAGVKVPRRLAPAIDTLEFYLEYLRGLQAVYEQESGLVDVNGVQVKPVKQALTDALSAAVVGGGGLADTAVATVPQISGQIAKPLSARNLQTLDISDFVDFDEPDHTDGLLAAVAAAKILNKGLVCRDTRQLIISTDVDMSGIREIKFNNDIFCSGGGASVIVGGFSNNSLSCNIKFNGIIDGTSLLTGTPPAKPLFDVRGLKSASVTIGHCNYMRLYADSSDVNTSSNAYSDYYLNGVIRKLELTDSGIGQSWNNENRFYGGRLIVLYITGVNYYHNHNIFYRPVLEGSNVDVKFNRAVDNTLIGVRAENTAASQGFNFDALSGNNKVILSWSNSGDTRGMFQVPIPVNDEGMGNSVLHEATYLYEKHPIATLDSSTVMVANSAISSTNNAATNPSGELFLGTKAVMTPSLKGFVVNSVNRWLVFTDYIPVEYGDVFTFDCDADGDVFRPVYYVYDADYKAITPDGSHIKQVGVSAGAKSYSATVDKSGDFWRQQPANVNSKAVKYIRVGVYSSTATYFEKVSFSLVTKKTPYGNKRSGIEQKPRALFINGAPTRGYVPRDTLVIDRLTLGNMWCTFSYETTTAVPLSGVDTTVEVTAVGGISNGDVYGVLMPSGKTSWGKVSDLSGSSFTITAAGEDIPTGSRIVFNRWLLPTVTPTEPVSP